jgi:hypothetical protein
VVVLVGRREYWGGGFWVVLFSKVFVPAWNGKSLGARRRDALVSRRSRFIFAPAKGNFMRSSLTALISCVAVGVVTLFGSNAAGGVLEWQAQVAAGTSAGYTRTHITSPIVDNIGTYSETTGGGISYEFIVNATNDGASSALLGTFENPPPIGDRAGLKWEQWQDTLHYGTTAFGVADFDSGVANTPNADTHVVYVNNGTDTLLYVNGSLAGTIAGSSPTLGGQQGIGQVYNPTGAHIDVLSGRIIGIAVYDAALSASEIGAHARAYFVPEPSSFMLLLLAGMLGIVQRRIS